MITELLSRTYRCLVELFQDGEYESSSLRLGAPEDGVEEAVEGAGVLPFLLAIPPDRRLAGVVRLLQDAVEAVRQSNPELRLHVDEAGILLLDFL